MEAWLQGAVLNFFLDTINFLVNHPEKYRVYRGKENT